MPKNTTKHLEIWDSVELNGVKYSAKKFLSEIHLYANDNRILFQPKIKCNVRAKVRGVFPLDIVHLCVVTDTRIYIYNIVSGNSCYVFNVEQYIHGLFNVNGNIIMVTKNNDIYHYNVAIPYSTNRLNPEGKSLACKNPFASKVLTYGKATEAHSALSKHYYLLTYRFPE